MYKTKIKKNINSNAFIEKRIVNYWNKRSKDFSNKRRQELDSLNGEAWLELINKHIPANQSLKVLDVGTGAGFFAILISSQGHKVIGIDMSPKMILEAKKNMIACNHHAEFKVMNAQKLDFEDESFDVVISRNLTWTLPDVMQAYREWHRVLKTDGLLMNFDSDYGDKNFRNEQTCSITNIDTDMLDECNAIKNSLKISTHTRPIWDVNFLRNLNFKVDYDLDIAPMVQRDDKLDYDSVPLFAIYAKKLSR